MKKVRFVCLLFVIGLSLFASGCKWSIVSITGPNCASPGQTITIYVAGTSQTEENSPTLYGLILQIPDSWGVLSAIVTTAGSFDTLTENTEYASLYTPEPGHKIWVGTATSTENQITKGTATVLLSVGDCIGQVQIKAAVGSYRNGAWTTDDPLGEFSFLNITEQRYVDTISCNCSSLSSWSPMTSGTTNWLNGVWGSSGSDIFAVGNDGNILHYNGTSWSPMTSGTTDSLHGIWGSSGSDIFAVGGNGNILHYNGTSWSPMTSGTTNWPHGVWGSSGSDVFAVQDGGNIVHYNGTSWSPMTSGTTNMLYGVWGSSGSDVFAVGQAGNILHYNGASWSPMTSGTTNFLYGVWGSSGSDVFAVGDGGDILHYNGTSWSPMTSGTTNRLLGVWGSSGSDVFAVGQAGNILHYNGASWSPMTSGTTNWLYGVWGSSGSDVFAVGAGGTILRYRDILYVSSDGNCGINKPCYSSMQAALNAAKSGALIKVEQGTYKEAPTKSTTGTVTISGGWNDTFAGQTGTTDIYAPMATGGAVLKVQPNVKIIAPQ